MKKPFTQKCYPRTYKTELAEDVFRIYDMDNNGSVDFQVYNLEDLEEENQKFKTFISLEWKF